MARLQAASSVPATLSSHIEADSAGAGWLIGFVDTETITVVASIRSSSLEASKDALLTEIEDARGLLPGGLLVVGTYAAGNEGCQPPTTAQSLAWKAAGSTTVSAHAALPAGRTSWSWAVQGQTHTTLVESPSEMDGTWLQSEYALLRFQSSLTVPVYGSAQQGAPSPASIASQCSSTAQTYLTQLESTKAILKFEVDVHNVAPAPPVPAAGKPGKGKAGKAKGSGGGGKDTGGMESVGAVLVGAAAPINTTCSQLAPHVTLTDPIRVSAFMLQTAEVSSHPDNASSLTAPSLSFTPANPSTYTVTNVSLNLDVLSYTPRSTTLMKAVEEAIVPAARAQVDALVACIERSPAGCLAASCSACTFHFQPPGWQVFVSVAYPLPPGGMPGPTAEDALVERRKALHGALGLPLDRPLLRAANAATFGGSGPVTSLRLRNTHIGIPPSKVVGGEAYLVQGDYEYFHYMQDHFDDNGWGCAYRSLQTLCSWYRLQHYTGRASPSHREVQELLVRIGDKPAEFVGSKKWIGSMELSFCLDELLGVSCKVITVQDGAEMHTKARELAHHFSTQGTPIMIGGGVLAYTLLGVNWNERTGECEFLILDPHYTGGEDLGTIQGPWCGWKKGGKDSKLFVQGAFYNLLCPQRPRTV